MRHPALHPWFNALLAFFYPETCQLCRSARATPADGFVCAGCRSHVQPIRPPFCQKCGRPAQGAITTTYICFHCRTAQLHFTTARSAVAAKDQVLEAIHRYKYQRALCFEPFLAGLLVDSAHPDLARQTWDYLVPVPLHPKKQREREFNQAERLARHLSAASGIPLNTRLIRRVVPTRTQTQLTREERLDNVRGAFAPFPAARLEAGRVVLVDDVFTTGATTSACAAALRRLGATEVCVWTLARGI